MTSRHKPPSRATKERIAPLPPIPRAVLSTHGMIPVTLVDDLRDPETGETLFGFWNAYTRTISIRAALDPTAAWLTLLHELTHADLGEIGVKLSDDQEEAICCALAAARFAALRLRGTLP